MKTPTENILSEELNSPERRWHGMLRELAPPHHYVFVHTVLRDFSQTTPDIFFNAMFSDRKDEFVRAIWEFTCKKIGIEIVPYFNHNDIKAVTGGIGGFPAVLVKMPKPHISPDAYYVAAVLLETELVKPDSKVAFITLERGIWDDYEEVGVLCGWNGTTHVNFEKVMGTDINDFCVAVEDILANRLEEAVGVTGAKKWQAFHDRIRKIKRKTN